MSAESSAGIQGHAFLASWLLHRDLDRATLAFERALDRDRHESKSGWLSHSALNLYQECPAKFYLQRVRGLERIRQTDPVAEAKTLEKYAKVAAQVKDACVWLANSGLDGSDRYQTLGTEIYIETNPPFKFRGYIDQLAVDVETGEWVVRDHKFTWRDDARVAARMLYGDQNLLYAATLNRDYRLRAGSTLILPRVTQLVTNIIVVSANGKHRVLRSETQLLTPEREELFWHRLHRTQTGAEAFASQADGSGWRYAREFMQPRNCVVFSMCPYVEICHGGANLDDSRFTRTKEAASASAEEDSE